MTNQNENESANQVAEKVGARLLLTKGFNFKFNVEGHEIHAWGSVKSGKEKVFVDGVLVSSKWSFTKKSIHSFKLNNDSYELEFNMVSLLTSELHCILIKNGVHFETQKQVPRATENKKKATWFISLHTIAGVICGYWLMALILYCFSN